MARYVQNGRGGEGLERVGVMQWRKATKQVWKPAPLPKLNMGFDRVYAQYGKYEIYEIDKM